MQDRIVDTFLGKVSPNAVDLEVSVIGAALLERQGQLVALEKLTPEDFYNQAHQEIFCAMQVLANNGIGIDMKTVKTQLQKTGKLDLVGGSYYLADLTSKVSSSANIEFYCLILIEKRILRDLIQLANNIHLQAHSHDADPFQILNEVSAFPVQIVDKIKSGSEKLVKDGIIALGLSINTRTADSKPIQGLATGYPAIDKILLGLKAANFIILASRPSVGKTTLAMNMARNIAVMFNEPVGVFELEMSYRELCNKLASMESDIPLKRLTGEYLSLIEVDRFISTTSKLAQSPIYIDDTPAISIMELRIRARRMVEKYKVKIIFIDYLQLMKGEPHTHKNREQEISSISRGCKLIAKELNIPVIALSQLSRDIEKRPLPRLPMLSDLRESGSLEQDTDIVAFLWRPEIMKIQGDEGGTFIPGLTKIIIAKHRNGELGEPCLQMLGHTSKFRDVDGPYTHQENPVQQQTQTPISDGKKSDPNDLPF